MSTRSVKVVLEAEVNKYLTNVKKAEKAASDAGKAAEDAGKQIDKAQEQAAKATEKSTDANKKHSDSGKESAKGSEESAKGSKSDAEAKARQAEAAREAGQALLVMGTASVAALGASTKAAMDWESAWAGVTKTVSGTPEQMAEIETGLRNLAKTLPGTHEEIAGVAEAAGQLGVKREDILKFTKTMVDLGETTNLTAEEAATDIAQIANVMGTTGDEVDNFGATLVALGNDGASTEKDILSMAQRIAGAGKLVGASEGEVLALSNTLASMGVKAELGGGVTTRVLLKMYKAVQDGGPLLDKFANTAGMTADQFAQAFSSSPVEALNLVTTGLARVKAEGGNVVATMTDLGLKGTEEMQVMLSLVGAGDLLSDSLKLQGEAWEKNTALTDEANKRYETTASKVKVAWNNIKDAAIDAGSVILPVVASLAENVSSLADTFGDLPEPVQQGIVVLTAVVGVAALVGGTLLTVVPKIRDGVQAFQDLNTRADGSSRGMGKAAKAAGVATASITALVAGATIFNNMFGKADVTVTQFTQGLLSAGRDLQTLNGLFRDGGLGTQIDGIGDAIARMNDKVMFDEFSMWLGDVSGSGSKLNTMRDNLKGVDTALTGLIEGGKGQEAATAFQAIAKAASDQGVPVEKLVDLFPAYRDKLLDAKNAAGETDVTQQDLAASMLAGGVAAESAGGSQEKLAAGLQTVTSTSGYTIAISEEVAKALEEIGLSADGTIVSLGKFTDVLFNMGLLQMDARGAARDWAQALADLGLQADGTGGQLGVLGTAFDDTTEAGRKNQAQFDATAQAGIRNLQAMADNGMGQDELQGKLQGTYNGLLAAAGQFGITGGEAEALARKVLGVPDGVTIDSWMSDAAKRMAEQTTGAVNAIPSRKDVLISIREETHRIAYEQRVVASGGAEPDGGGLYGSDSGRAAGGAIYGPGTSTSDEAGLFRLSPGEHVFDAADVQKMGGQQAVYKFRTNLRSGQFDGFAAGGAVASTSIMAQTRFSQPALSGAGRKVDQHFYGVTDPVSLAYHAARIQEEG
jgi:TP901 family phage tail tape measure protein